MSAISGSNRKLPRAAVEVMCAFIELNDIDRQAFNSAMNEYLLSSPMRRRELLEYWCSNSVDCRGEGCGDD